MVAGAGETPWCRVDHFAVDGRRCAVQGPPLERWGEGIDNDGLAGIVSVDEIGGVESGHDPRDARLGIARRDTVR